VSRRRAIYFNVAPRYTAGSPAQVDQETAWLGRLLLLAALAALALLLSARLAGAAQGITWNGPKLTPAEAAEVLRQAPGLSNVALWPAPLPEGGPQVYVFSGRPEDGPFGAFPRYPAARSLRCCSLYVNGWPVTGHRAFFPGIPRPILTSGIPKWSTAPRR
jgi:hypothetical protein